MVMKYEKKFETEEDALQYTQWYLGDIFISILARIHNAKELRFAFSMMGVTGYPVSVMERILYGEEEESVG